jgi:hypothetical protein
MSTATITHHPISMATAAAAAVAVLAFVGLTVVNNDTSPSTPGGTSQVDSSTHLGKFHYSQYGGKTVRSYP